MAVRTESVRLSLDDAGFTTGMAKAAAAAALLEKQLDNLDGTNVDLDKSVTKSSASVDSQGSAFRSSGSEIDKFSGRLRLLADTAAIIGPALVPLGAVAVPAVTGLASQLGFAALGAGTLAVAFQGVGEAVSSVNAYALEPTTANLEKAQTAMSQLAPAAQQFVLQLRDMMPALREVRDATATGFFAGGGTAALTDLEAVLPRVQSIFVAVAREAGNFAEETAASFNSDRWTPFFDYLATEAPRALSELGSTVGSLTHGFAELWMAFTPLNRDFSGWLMDSAKSFDSWSAGLAKTDGFGQFVDYIEANGPRVSDALGAVGSAVIEIVTALAPLGGPSLQIIETFADVVGAIADSDIGTPLLVGVGALAAYNRALAVTTALQARMAAGGLFANMTTQSKALGLSLAGTATSAKSAIPSLGQFGTVAYRAGQSTKFASDETLKARMAVGGFARSAVGIAAPLAGLALAATDLGDNFALSGTAAGALMGTLGGPFGVAIGAAVGVTQDMSREMNNLATALNAVDLAKQSGDLDQMRESQRGLSSAVGETSAFLAGLATVNPFSDLEHTFADAKAESASFGAEIRNLSQGGLAGGEALASLLAPTRGLGSAFSIAGRSVDEFSASFARLNGLLNTTDALIAYNQSMKTLRDSIRGNGQAWDFMSAKGQENNQNLNASARAVESYANTLKEAGREQAAASFLKSSIQSFREIGNQSEAAAERVRPIIRALKEAGGIKARAKLDVDTGEFVKKTDKSRAELRSLDKSKATAEATLNSSPFEQRMRSASNQVRELDSKKPTPTAGLNNNPFVQNYQRTRGDLTSLDRATATPTVNANTGAAQGAIQAVINALSNVRDKSVTVTTYYRSTGAIKPPGERKDGGYITGPGGPRDDAIPTMLSNGEYVVNAAATARNRPLLEQINAQRFADGGFVRRQPVQPQRVVGRQASNSRVSVAFDGPAEIPLRMPDGSVQMARIAARVARQEYATIQRDDEREAR